jgi:hypothetical protein
MNGQKSNSVNVILMALVGLLVGFIGGYFVGQRSAPAGGASLATNTAGTLNCPHTLETKDQWIIAGFRCPGTEDAQVALLGCHCNIAHAIEDRVKAELAGGKTGQQVRDGLMMEYGARLNFKTQ